MPAALNPNAAAFVPPTSALSAVLSATALERSPSMPLAIPAKSGAERLRPAQLQEDEEDEELEQLQQQLFAADDEDPALVSAWPLVTRMRRFTALSSGGRHAIGSRLPTACLSAHRGQHLAPCHVGPAKFPAWPLTKCCVLSGPAHAHSSETLTASMRASPTAPPLPRWLAATTPSTAA